MFILSFFGEKFCNKPSHETLIFFKNEREVIRKVDIEKQYEQILRLELDYELASLYSAMQEKDEKEMEKCKKRLKEIQDELDGLHAYV